MILRMITRLRACGRMETRLTEPECTVIISDRTALLVDMPTVRGLNSPDGYSPQET